MILQWNCRGLISQWSEMKNFFSVLASIVIALQETWFLPTDVYNFNLPNYSLYRCDDISGQRRQGGVALYVNNDFSHREIPLQTDLQAVACTTYINGRNIDICSIYIPPTSDTADIFQQLNGLIRQFRNPFLLLGDFNCHSPHWWTRQRLDVRGKKVEDFIAANNLVILNGDQPTYFSPSHNTETAIDLSLCSPILGTWFDWNADSDIYNSDHYPIYLKTTFHAEGTPSFVPRWNLMKADWQTFTNLCETIQIEEAQTTEQTIVDITNTLLSAARQTIPKTKPCSRRNAVPWWSPAIQQAIARRKRTFRAFLRHRTDDNLINKNKERARTQRIIRTAKRASWQHFLSKLSSSTPLSQIWHLVRRLSGKRCHPHIPIFYSPQNNAVVSEPKAVVNVMAERFAHHSSDDNYSRDFLAHARTTFNDRPDTFASDNEEEYNCLFSLSELKTAIILAGNTSVGPDDLHYSFFRHLSDATLNTILRTLNNLWQEHVFPEQWRESIIIAIPKPGKLRSNPDNYRPIALTSCFGKIFERMVSKRLSYVFEKHSMLSKYQCGFRKNHSPVDQLVRLETDIRKGFKHRQHTAAVFLDIQKAYDMVHRPAVVHKLQKLGLKGHLAYYLQNFLIGRRNFRVKNRSVFSDYYDMENGLPQGSCLSPLLFNVFIDDLFLDISPGVSFSLFADDSAMWCSGPDYDVCLTRLQGCLAKLEQWSRTNGLQFSSEKSAAIIFSRTMNIQPSQSLRLHNNEIPYVTNFKFLGVILDRRLSMARHIKYIGVKCNSRLNLFRCITGATYGADRETLIRLYRSLVLPIIEYGAVVYAGGVPSALKSLETIQNSFIRISIGAMKTSPIAALQVEADISPLRLRRQELSIRYVTKIKQFPHHATRKAIDILPRIHHNYVGRSEKRSGLTIASRVNAYSQELQFCIPDITPLPVLTVAPWKLHSRMVSLLFEFHKRDVSSLEAQQTFQDFRNEHMDYQFIYTDGSKGDGGTGNGIVVEGRGTLKGRLPNNTSVYIAELHAILIALRLSRVHDMKKICICSDSKSALQSLLNPTFNQHLHYEVLNIHQELVETGTHVKFLWIPGHCGIAGNERADEEAKAALTLPTITDIPTNYHSVKSSLRQSSKLLWQKQWRDDVARTQLHVVKPEIGRWNSCSRSNRLEEKALAKLRIGHTYFTHSYIYSQSRRPVCGKCHRPLTVKHLLLFCDDFTHQRRILTNYCTTNRLPFSLSVLLGDDNPDLLTLLFRFLQETHLLTKL